MFFVIILYMITFQVNEIEKQLNAIRDNIKIGEERAAKLDRKMEEQQVLRGSYKDIIS